MPAMERVRAMLEEQGVAYRVVEHSAAETARAEARAAGVKPRDWAKSLAVRLDGQPTVVVLPASSRLDLERLTGLAGAEEAELVPEDALADLYPDCELGAIPPFGALYGQQTFVDHSLREDERIGFHAGTHTEALVMAYPDWERVARAVPGRFAVPGET